MKLLPVCTFLAFSFLTLASQAIASDPTDIPPPPLPPAPAQIVVDAQSGPWKTYHTLEQGAVASCALSYDSRTQARTPLLLMASPRDLTLGSHDPANDFSPNEVEKVTLSAGQYHHMFRLRGTDLQRHLLRAAVPPRQRIPLLTALGNTLTVSVQLNNMRPHPLKMLHARPALAAFQNCAQQAGFLKALGVKEAQ